MSIGSFFSGLASGVGDFLGGASDYVGDAVEGTGDYLFGSSSPTDNVSALSSPGDYVPNEIPSFDDSIPSFDSTRPSFDSPSLLGNDDFSFLPPAASETVNSKPGLFSEIGSALLKPAVLGGVLQSGIGLVGGLQQIDAAKESRKEQLEAEKFKYLIELAKLKYGPKSGGGGGGRSSNAAVISALNQGTANKVNALQNFGASYAQAVK